MARVAMFGLGNMGLPIAECLLSRGHELVTAVHSSTKGPDRVKELGGSIADSPYEAVQGADYIITCVPADAHLKAFLLDPQMIEAVQPGQTIIDLSTTAADSVKEAAAPYLAKGVKFIDAPLTGQPVHAYVGGITLLCGCTKDTYDEAKDFMCTFSKNQWYVGDVGSGKISKLCNNMITATNKLMVGEMCKVVKANGVDPDGFKNVISTSPNHNAQFDLVWDVVSVDNFEPKFALKLMRKDTRLANALMTGLNCELFELVYKMYRRAGAIEGLDELDCNAVVKAEDMPV